MKPDINKLKSIAVFFALFIAASSNLQAQTFRKVEVSSFPEITDQLNDQNLIRCINNCITYFNRLDPAKWHSYQVDNRPVSIPDMVSSLQAFLN